METAQLILEKGNALFLKYGIRSVSMDDIAKELGISKKTLYIHFAKKEDLITQAMEFQLAADANRCQEIFDSEKNAIDELVELGQYVRSHIRSINPTAIYDLQKYYPKIWRVLEEKRSNLIYEITIANIDKGIKEGLFRNDFSRNIVARFYIARMNAMLDQKLFPADQFKWEDIHLDGLKYHIHGIASEKGYRYFHKLIDKIKEKQNA